MADQNVIDDLRAESERIDRVVAASVLAVFAAMAQKTQHDFDGGADNGLVECRAPTPVALLVRRQAERAAAIAAAAAVSAGSGEKGTCGGH